VDFIHGNPHKTKANAMQMMVLYPPIMGFIAVIGSLLVFALPQCFQAVVSDALIRRLGRRGQFGILLALPITATLAWYCYDYLTPTDVNLGINAAPDWMPWPELAALSNNVDRSNAYIAVQPGVQRCSRSMQPFVTVPESR
jgi:hypothetical protein